jgi:hypothetical protein
LIIGLALVHSPIRFKIVKGLLERLSIKEISEKYKINYVYLVKVLNKMTRKGLLIRARLFKNTIYIPKPEVSKAFKIALKELYIKTSKMDPSQRDSFLKNYSLTYKDLVKTLGLEEKEGSE